MARESQLEIKRIFNDKNIKNFYNYNYYITNVINFFNKKHHILNENQTETSFPLLNNMHVLSKTISPIKNNKHLHLSNNQSSKHNINKFIEDKEKN